MGIYGNIDKMTLLEYYISDESKQINSMLPSLTESISINEGNVWKAVKTVFEKIKNFFKFLKDKLSLLIDKIKTFIARTFTSGEHKPISTHYVFNGKEKELAKEIEITYHEYNIDFIIKDLKSNYLKDINTIWDDFLFVVDRRVTKKSYPEIKNKTEELEKDINEFVTNSNNLKDKYNKDHKEISIPCLDGLSKAAIMHNNWFSGIKTIVYDLELHVKNLNTSIEVIHKDINYFESLIEKHNGDSTGFKDDHGDELDLRDNCLILTKWEMLLNKISSAIGASLSTIGNITKDIELIPGKIKSAEYKIKYHKSIDRNEKKSNEVD